MLEYSLVSGRFYNNGKRVGAHDKSNGTVAVRFQGKKNYAHRTAWFLITGQWPVEVDHIDTNRLNNAWHNLRNVGRSVNQQNLRKAMSNNRTGLLGVSPYRGRFRATIVLNRQQVTVGYYDSPEAAHAAYLGAKRRLHEGNTL